MEDRFWQLVKLTCNLGENYFVEEARHVSSVFVRALQEIITLAKKLRLDFPPCKAKEDGKNE